MADVSEKHNRRILAFEQLALCIRVELNLISEKKTLTQKPDHFFSLLISVNLLTVVSNVTKYESQNISREQINIQLSQTRSNENLITCKENRIFSSSSEQQKGRFQLLRMKKVSSLFLDSLWFCFRFAVKRNTIFFFFSFIKNLGSAETINPPGTQFLQR